MNKRINNKEMNDEEIANKVRELKSLGFGNKKICEILNIATDELEKIIEKYKIYCVYKMVDTCGGEFEAATPYYYSTYNDYEDESIVSDRKKVIILGSGPIRIGQGIEFDYCTVHAIKALKEENIEAIVINNNPETVSTDFDISDKLYFEPLTLDSVLNIINKESRGNSDKNFLGVIVQFGGQTSINLANALKKYNVKILGTQPEYINIAEDRELNNKFLEELKIPKPKGGTGYSYEQVRKIANEISYPILIRPSYVLGGRAMEIVYNDEELKEYMKEAIKFSEDEIGRHPILIDKFLSDAIEVDVDAVCDGEDVLIGGIMEHIEEAGIHSGDSAMVIPPQTLKKETINTIKNYTEKIALNLKTIGLINIQFAVTKDGNVYVIESNPRASRTVPFVSKAIRLPIAKIATKVILGKKIKDLMKEYNIKTLYPYENLNYVCVKEVVFPFVKFRDIDPALGPEMKSTGEVMGIGRNFGEAFYKAELAAGTEIPLNGNIFISVRSEDKEKFLSIAKRFYELNFSIFSTSGTSRFLIQNGIKNTRLKKISEGEPNVLNYLRERKIDMVINIPKLGKNPRKDGYLIRRSCIELNIPYITTIEASKAAIKAIEALKLEKNIVVKALDEY